MIKAGLKATSDSRVGTKASYSVSFALLIGRNSLSLKDLYISM